MKAQDHSLIHPEDSSNLHYWTKKWGVTVRQLDDAILYTGSLNPVLVKEYLKKNAWYRLPLFHFFKVFKNKNHTVHL